MIRLSSYYIAAEDVEAVTSEESGRPDYPHRIIVTVKSGRLYSVDYRDERRRDEVVSNIVRTVEAERARALPPTMQTIRWAVQAEVDKLRPYLRRIEKQTKGADGADK